MEKTIKKITDHACQKFKRDLETYQPIEVNVQRGSTTRTLIEAIASAVVFELATRTYRKEG